jgi:chromate transporter
MSARLAALVEVLLVATRLGFTSFGGPIAHLGYFRDEYVVRRRWLDEQSYADLVALCQFLPGPASSQVGIAIGIIRAGFVGGLVAWLGFTLPSAAFLVAFAYGMRAMAFTDAAWLHGLKVVAVAVVAQAVLGMAKNLCPDRPRATIAVLASCTAFAIPSALGQVSIIVISGLLGWRLFTPGPTSAPHHSVRVPYGRLLGVSSFALFFTLLLGTPLLGLFVDGNSLSVFDSFYRVGSLVFGGGHVVLPLLHSEVVSPGWVTDEYFIAGYGATQAVPGPLFTFAAYLGAGMKPFSNGLIGGAFALTAIFLPSFLLVIGALPFWDELRARPSFQSALKGINAAVVGLLLAALYHPVWTSAIHSSSDFALALAGFFLLTSWGFPSWLVVILSAIGSAALSWIAW